MTNLQSECFDYNGAAKIIEAKGLLDEINSVIAEVTPPSGKPPPHRRIEGLLEDKG